MKQEQLIFTFYDQVLGKVKLPEKIYQQKLQDNFKAISSGLKHKNLREIELRINELGSKGYQFLQGWSMEFYSPDKIVLPNERIMDFLELLIWTKENPSNGYEQLSRLEATEFWSLVDSVPYSERTYQGPNFLEDFDETKIRRRHKPINT